MEAIRAKTANRTYTGEGCEPLPATVIQFSDKKVVVETCFEISKEELEELQKSGKIYLTFVGETIIPFMLHTKSNVVQDNKKSSR